MAECHVNTNSEPSGFTSELLDEANTICETVKMHHGGLWLGMARVAQVLIDLRREHENLAATTLTDQIALTPTMPTLAEVEALRKRLATTEQQAEDLMDLIRRSLMEHGDCKSGERYGGQPKACTACMAQLKLKELASNWKGRKVRLA